MGLVQPLGCLEGQEDRHSGHREVKPPANEYKDAKRPHHTSSRTRLQAQRNQAKAGRKCLGILNEADGRTQTDGPPSLLPTFPYLSGFLASEPGRTQRLKAGNSPRGWRTFRGERRRDGVGTGQGGRAAALCPPQASESSGSLASPWSCKGPKYRL